MYANHEYCAVCVNECICIHYNILADFSDCKQLGVGVARLHTVHVYTCTCTCTVVDLKALRNHLILSVVWLLFVYIHVHVHVYTSANIKQHVCMSVVCKYKLQL